LNVGTAGPLVRQLSLGQIACSMLIVLAVNLTNFTVGSAIAWVAGLRREHQVTSVFSSGMRSNGTALVVGLASFPNRPLVTVPAAIYIILQHLLAGVVKSRLAVPSSVAPTQRLTPVSKTVDQSKVCRGCRRSVGDPWKTAGELCWQCGVDFELSHPETRWAYREAA